MTPAVKKFLETVVPGSCEFRPAILEHAATGEVSEIWVCAVTKVITGLTSMGGLPTEVFLDIMDRSWDEGAPEGDQRRDLLTEKPVLFKPAESYYAICNEAFRDRFWGARFKGPLFQYIDPKIYKALPKL